MILRQRSGGRGTHRVTRIKQETTNSICTILGPISHEFVYSSDLNCAKIGLWRSCSLVSVGPIKPGQDQPRTVLFNAPLPVVVSCCDVVFFSAKGDNKTSISDRWLAFKGEYYSLPRMCFYDSNIERSEFSLLLLLGWTLKEHFIFSPMFIVGKGIPFTIQYPISMRQCEISTVPTVFYFFHFILTNNNVLRSIHAEPWSGFRLQMAQSLARLVIREIAGLGARTNIIL